MAQNLHQPRREDTRGRSLSLKEERGFWLLETVLLGCILLAAAGGIAILRYSAEAGHSCAERLQAIYLAQAQMERVRERADRMGLDEGSLPWLGKGGSLEKSGAWQVETAVGPATADDVHEVQVTVIYPSRGRQVEIRFERAVRGKGKERAAP